MSRECETRNVEVKCLGQLIHLFLSTPFDLLIGTESVSAISVAIQLHAKCFLAEFRTNVVIFKVTVIVLIIQIFVSLSVRMRSMCIYCLLIY